MAQQDIPDSLLVMSPGPHQQGEMPALGILCGTHLRHEQLCEGAALHGEGLPAHRHFQLIIA